MEKSWVLPGRVARRGLFAPRLEALFEQRKNGLLLLLLSFAGHADPPAVKCPDEGSD